MNPMVSIVLSLATAYAGALAWLFRVQYLAVSARDGLREFEAEQEKELTSLEDRLERVENIAGGVAKLAVSFEFLTEKLSTELKYFTERQADAQNFVSSQLADIKQELSHVRANAAMAKEIATRTTARTAR